MIPVLSLAPWSSRISYEFLYCMEEADLTGDPRIIPDSIGSTTEIILLDLVYEP